MKHLQPRTTRHEIAIFLVIPAEAQPCLIKSPYTLRMIFAMKSVINHMLRRCLYLNILFPWPKLGKMLFCINNQLVTSCPGVSRMLHDTYIVIPAKAGISGQLLMHLWLETPADLRGDE